jgi:ribosomal protein L4
MLATTFKNELEIQKNIETLLKEKNRRYNKRDSKVVEHGIEYEILGSDDLFIEVAIMGAGATTFTR